MGKGPWTIGRARGRRWRRASALLLALAIGGCRAEPEPGVAAGPRAALEAGPAGAAQAPLERETRRLLAADSLLAGEEAARVAEALHALVDTATLPDVRAPALLRLGLLETRLWAWEQPEGVRAARPGEYAFSEIAGSWLYQGTELTELLEAYPVHVLADDAAFARTALPLGAECEGWVPCYVYASTGRLVDFLDAHPRSEHAAGAVRAVDAGFRSALADHPDLTVATELYDPVEVRERVEAWEAVARRLGSADRSLALRGIAELWERFGDTGRAEAARAGG